MSDTVLIPAANPGPLTGTGNNTWLIDGAEPTLVDAGVGGAEHLDAIARALRGRALARVLVTHGHADHASGIPALTARWPSIEVCKWTAGTIRGWRRLYDGTRVRAGNIELVTLHTPGHAEDHACFWHEATRDLFTGDMLIAHTTVMIPEGGGGDLADYLASLERLKALAPARAYPGHGAIIDRPVTLIDEYLAHRALRDRQILACLADGITDVDAIVARIYTGVPAAVLPAARLTVKAHLRKLREA
jgi:hydroxyacylglutathione hydrolase